MQSIHEQINYIYVTLIHNLLYECITYTHVVSVYSKRRDMGVQKIWQFCLKSGRIKCWRILI